MRLKVTKQEMTKLVMTCFVSRCIYAYVCVHLTLKVALFVSSIEQGGDRQADVIKKTSVGTRTRIDGKTEMFRQKLYSSLVNPHIYQVIYYICTRS